MFSLIDSTYPFVNYQLPNTMVEYALHGFMVICAIVAFLDFLDT